MISRPQPPPQPKPPAQPDTSRDRRFVGALARGLHVLRCFDPDDQWLGHREIARRTGLPPSTVSRLAYTLKQLGCLKAGPGIGQYGLDVGVIALGFRMLGRYEIARIARPHMPALADEAQASVSLAVQHGPEALFVGHCKGSAARPVIGLDVGARLPMLSTAVGRALIATLDAESRALLLLRFARDGQAVDGADIGQRMAEFAQTGFTSSAGEWQAGLNAVAAPVLLGGGMSPLALSCGASSAQLAGPLLQAMGRRVVAVADVVRRAVQRGA